MQNQNSFDFDYPNDDKSQQLLEYTTYTECGPFLCSIFLVLTGNARRCLTVGRVWRCSKMPESVKKRIFLRQTEYVCHENLSKSFECRYLGVAMYAEAYLGCFESSKNCMRKNVRKNRSKIPQFKRDVYKIGFLRGCIDVSLYDWHKIVLNWVKCCDKLWTINEKA